MTFQGCKVKHLNPAQDWDPVVVFCMVGSRVCIQAYDRIGYVCIYTTCTLSYTQN